MFKGNDDHFRSFSRNAEAYPDYYDDPAFHYQSFLVCSDANGDNQPDAPPDAAPTIPTRAWKPPDD